MSFVTRSQHVALERVVATYRLERALRRLSPTDGAGPESAPWDQATCRPTAAQEILGLPPEQRRLARKLLP